MKCKEEGGLNMIDFALFDKAIKLCWVKRLCFDEKSPLKFIPTSLLSNVGGNLLFRWNYDVKYLKLNDQILAFYRNIISYWQELNTIVPKQKEDVLNQIIWNNRFIKIGNASVFFAELASCWHPTPLFSIKRIQE